MFFFFICHLKTNLEEAKSKNLPFASCNINYVQFRMIADTKHAEEGALGRREGAVERGPFHPLLGRTNLAVQDTHNTK